MPLPPHFRSLQAIRGLAAWMVVGHHIVQAYWGLNTTIPFASFFGIYGDFGVDIFFVLSGVVMAMSIQRSQPSAWQFFAKRIIRIVPAYWTATLALVALMQVLPNAFSYTEVTVASFIKSLLFIPHDNPGPLGAFPALTVGWTLNYEMAFYAVLAIGLAMVRRYPLPFSAGVLLAAYGLFPREWPWGAVLRNWHILEFISGLGIVALLQASKIWNRFFSQRMALLLVAGVAVLCGANYSLHWIMRVALASCIVTTGMMAEEYLSQVPGIRILTTLGNWSYSTYLLHLLAIGVVVAAMGVDGETFHVVSGIGLVIVSTVVLSAMSYRWIESNRWIRSLQNQI